MEQSYAHLKINDKKTKSKEIKRKMKNTNQLLVNFSIAFYLAMGFGMIDIHFAKAQKQKLTPAPQTSVSSEAGQALELGNSGGLAKKEEEMKKDTTFHRNPPQNASSEATEKTQREEIEAYIREKFGEDADKAFLLLRGSGKCGGENPRLDQRAVNTNKDGSKDYGIFQINDKYHPVYRLNLHTDWKANIDYAYRMFENDNHTFTRRWAAAKCLLRHGIKI